MRLPGDQGKANHVNRSDEGNPTYDGIGESFSGLSRSFAACGSRIADPLDEGRCLFSVFSGSPVELFYLFGCKQKICWQLLAATFTARNSPVNNWRFTLWTPEGHELNTQRRR